MAQASPEMLECNYCDRKLTNNDDLEVHVQTHTGSRTFQCKNCDKSFSMNSDIISHECIHAMEKVFQCSKCDKSFSSKDIFVRHVKHTHRREAISMHIL